MKWGYIWAKKLESERSKSFAVFISMRTKAIRSYFRVRGTKKYSPSSGKPSRSWSKSRCAKGELGYSFSLKVKWGFISSQKLENERSKSLAVSSLELLGRNIAPDYISAQKLESDRSKALPVSISLQTKASRS